MEHAVNESLMKVIIIGCLNKYFPDDPQNISEDRAQRTFRF